MPSSFKNLKVIFTILSVIAGIFFFIGMIVDISIGCLVAVILLPIIIIAFRAFLKILENEMESESYGVSRRMIDLESKLEELENKLAEIELKKSK